jgi:hypothetical protein
MSNNSTNGFGTSTEDVVGLLEAQIRLIKEVGYDRYLNNIQMGADEDE